MPSGSSPWGRANSPCSQAVAWRVLVAGAMAVVHPCPPHPGLVSCPSVGTDVDAHMENVTVGKRGGEHRPQTDVKDHRSQWRSKEKHYLCTAFCTG